MYLYGMKTNERGDFLEMTMTSLADLLQEFANEKEDSQIAEDFMNGRKSAFKQASEFMKMRLKGLDEMYSK